jgi:hypothetical protein
VTRFVWTTNRFQNSAVQGAATAGAEILELLFHEVSHCAPPL